MKKQIVKFLDHTCRVYTVTAVLFLLLQMVIAGSANETVIRPEAFLLILPFAAIFAVADMIYGLPRVSVVLRVFVHFVLVVAGACACLYMPMMGANHPTSYVLTAALAFAAVYWVCMLPYLMVSAMLRRMKTTKK